MDQNSIHRVRRQALGIAHGVTLFLAMLVICLPGIWIVLSSLRPTVEIMAKPPGKKLQSLSLLSGGEQALTAMALIFAVFLTNPAPICVLDEVDAPLDDHNVERFCDLLDEMIRSTETRFVIITHNPITMARMNRLYGVTMAERGVSQLVSVDLEAAVEILDQAGAA